MNIVARGSDPKNKLWKVSFQQQQDLFNICMVFLSQIEPTIQKLKK